MKHRTPVGLLLGVLILSAGSGTLPTADAETFHRAGRKSRKCLDVLEGEIRLIHDAQDGYAELPSLAISPSYAYVAFDVRTNGLTNLHICRLDRTGEEKLERIVLTAEDKLSFGSSMAPEEDDTIWLAWTSHTDGQWLIEACRVRDMQPYSRLVISDSDGLNSQVQVASHDGVTWFVWALWKDGKYRVMANVFDSRLGQPRTIYESSNPVGRPDLCIASPDRVVFVWDEFIDGRFVIRKREQVGGRLEPVEQVSGETSANCWDPCVCAAADEVLTGWQRVGRGEVTCRLAARVGTEALYERDLHDPKNRETWRVKCFSAPDGKNWAVWLNRIGHRSTNAFLRRIGPNGASELCRVCFVGQQRFFMNYLDCACDHNLTMVWSSWGSVSLSEVELPELADEELAAIDEDEDTSIDLRKKITYSISYEGDSLHVYFGDYHNHTSFSDGRTFPDMVMLFARDNRKLDFICVTDHDGSLMPSEFAWNNSVADLLTVDGEFVCLHGFEVSKKWAENGFGHWNMLFPGPVTIFRYEDGMTPPDLYEVAGEYDAVLIPHHIAKRFAPHSWDYCDPEVESVVEMCSIHGIFESGAGLEEAPDMVQGRFVEDGLAKGYRIGFVGASDFHNPFRGIKSEAGLTGVYAPTLAPGSVIEAIKKRRTFATTGSMTVLDFRCNGRFMGEHMQAAGEISFSGYARAADPITSMEILSDGKTVFQTEPDDTEASFTWETSVPDSEAYYYLRVTTSGGDLAWSSPIWITPNQ